MGVTISPIEDDEMLRAFEITALAFERHEPGWDALYPKHWTASGQKAAADRWILKKHTDPKCIFAKAVDDETGTIIGTCQWFLYHPSVPEAQGKVQGDDIVYEADDDQDWAEEILKAFSTWREGAVERTNGQVIDLECLAVDPAWHKRGAGTALVAYGCEIADRLGVEGVVGSTKVGQKTYGKNGYVPMYKDVVLEVPEQFADRPLQHFTWMGRPKKV